MQKIGIIDYGMGNIYSVSNALLMANADVTICKTPKELDTVHKIVIPGVGSYDKCMKKLIELGFVDKLNQEVILNGKPTLGICLGMQILSTLGYEGGQVNGLNYIPGTVNKIELTDKNLKVPHIGWNSVSFNHSGFLTSKLKAKNLLDFYFVHSFHFIPNEEEDIWADCEYDNKKIVAAVLKDNIIGTQFHPEKSQENGILFLKDFVNWKPC